MDNSKQTKSISSFQKFVLKYHRYATVLIVLTLLIGGYSFVLKPKYQAVSQGGSFNLKTLKSQKAQREAYLSDLKDLSSSFSNISRADITKLESILPDDSDIPGLFVQLERLALKNDLFLASVDINEASDSVRAKIATGEVARLDINLSLVAQRPGDYKGLKLFLADVENSLRLFDINSIFFVPDSPDYTINMFAYYYP